MTRWLLLLFPLVTAAYAVYEMGRSSRVRRLGVAVILSAAAIAFCLFGLERLLFWFREPSSFDPLGDGIGIAITAMMIGGTVFVVHLVLLVLLMRRADPDVPEM